MYCKEHAEMAKAFETHPQRNTYTQSIQRDSFLGMVAFCTACNDKLHKRILEEVTK